jgi:hypothetical protein
MSASTEATTRRALLGAGLGAIAATVAGALGRANPLRAANGDPVIVGAVSQGTAVTRVNNTGSGDGLMGQAANSDGAGVRGAGRVAGVRGNTQAGIGVIGEATQQGRFGVQGRATGGSASAVFGDATSTSGQNTGVRGRTASNAGTGVLGIATATGGTTYAVRGQNASSRGTAVIGRATATSGTTYGVYGESRSSSGFGVFGVANSGTALHGQTNSGVGVQATADSGIALRTQGRVQLQSISGRSTVPAGSSQVTVSPEVPLTSSSFIIATINGNPIVPVWVFRVGINVSRNQFTVVLTGNVAQDVRVAWLILG